MKEGKTVSFRADKETLKDIEFIRKFLECGTDTEAITSALKLLIEIKKLTLAEEKFEHEKLTMLYKSISESTAHFEWFIENAEKIKNAFALAEKEI